MKKLSELDASRVRAVFTDIDDTITTEGRLPADAYAALWKLFEANIPVVPVTGRPAGWCDHFARMWPIAGIVGENGAFYFRYDTQGRKMISRWILSETERAALPGRLAKIRDRVLKEVPRSAIASDQRYRIHDLAIDFCEDVVPGLSDSEVKRIVEIFTEEGATAKVSSIHVNGWFGDYDKLGMMKILAREVLSLELDGADRSAVIYAGDSPNDEPAFEFFPLSVGVANVQRFAATMKHVPEYVTPSEGGSGFTELAEHILNARK
jgi:HAD superfamily hydrolase (TIGR01484 family)